MHFPQLLFLSEGVLRDLALLRVGGTSTFVFYVVQSGHSGTEASSDGPTSTTEVFGLS